MKDFNFEKIRENLVTKRKSCGMTQSDVAEALNVTKQMVSFYELHPERLRLSMWSTFAKLYNCHPADFFAGM